MLGSLKSSIYGLLAAAALSQALPNPSSFLEPRLLGGQIVNLRIEGLTKTIYEGPIFSTPRNITTPSGGTHHCDGTNLGANPNPGATPTTALDAAAHLPLDGFPYDGTFSTSFDDYFITSIGSSTQTATQFWGLLVNYQFAPVGGCQFETSAGDHVLWAFDAFNKVYFLKVTPSAATIQVGKSATFTVTDGTSGAPVAGASFAGHTSDAAGKVTITGSALGLKKYKATKSDAIRSNAVEVVTY